MSLRFLPLVLAGSVLLAGLAVSDEPGKSDEPPVRLKKKKRAGEDKPAADPAKPSEKKKEDKKKDKGKEEEGRPAEPVTPQEEESEVLNRIVQNVRGVDERLAKNDLGEGTQQTQRDILKDIESLIKMSENPPPDSGGGAGQKNDNNDPQNQQAKGQSKAQGKGQGKSGQQKRVLRRMPRRRSAGQRMAKRQGSGQPSGSPKPSGQKTAQQKPGGANGKNGNGGGGDSRNNPLRPSEADLYKAVWGHLPETMRAQMDAYSNTGSFLPKYDDLIRRYYRTIAEQGRRKGE